MTIYVTIPHSGTRAARWEELSVMAWQMGHKDLYALYNELQSVGYALVRPHDPRVSWPILLTVEMEVSDEHPR